MTTPPIDLPYCDGLPSGPALLQAHKLVAEEMAKGAPWTAPEVPAASYPVALPPLPDRTLTAAAERDITALSDIELAEELARTRRSVEYALADVARCEAAAPVHDVVRQRAAGAARQELAASRRAFVGAQTVQRNVAEVNARRCVDQNNGMAKVRRLERERERLDVTVHGIRGALLLQRLAA